MPAQLAVIIPTWHRAQRLKGVAENVKAATRSKFQLYWGCEPDDRESILAAADTGFPVIINKGVQGHADTAQTAYEQTKEPFMFFGNDDFLFTDGWDVGPMRVMKDRPELMVLGLEDGLDNTFWTIHLIRRQYIEEHSGVMDMPNRVYYPYNHNFQDTELTQTAMKRGVWDRLEGPCITHLRLDKDETYEKNDATFSTDHGIYLGRSHLFI